MWNLEDHERNLLMGKNTYIRNVQILKDVDISQSKAVGYFWIWCSTQDQILGWWGWTLRHLKKRAKTHQSKGSGSSCKLFVRGNLTWQTCSPDPSHFAILFSVIFSVVKAWKQKSCVKLQPSLKPKTPCFFNIQSAKTMHITIIGIRMYIYHYCVWQLYYVFSLQKRCVMGFLVAFSTWTLLLSTQRSFKEIFCWKRGVPWTIQWQFHRARQLSGPWCE